MQKFDITGPVAVALGIPAGSVHLVATDRAEATVQVLPANPGKKRDIKAAEQTAVECRDGVLRIATADPSRILGSSGSVVVRIEVPAGSSFDGKAGAAELHGTGRLGEVVFDGGYQTVALQEAAGARLKVHTGTVTITRLTGPAQIVNGMGDVTVTEATAGKVELRTGSGNLTVGTAPGVSATLDASTTYGRVHNALMNTDGPAASVHIEATTGHGDVTATSR
jgi:hypothetical protein